MFLADVYKLHDIGVSTNLDVDEHVVTEVARVVVAVSRQEILDAESHDATHADSAQDAVQSLVLAMSIQRDQRDDEKQRQNAADHHRSYERGAAVEVWTARQRANRHGEQLTVKILDVVLGETERFIDHGVQQLKISDSESTKTAGYRQLELRVAVFGR